MKFKAQEMLVLGSGCGYFAITQANLEVVQIRRRHEH